MANLVMLLAKTLVSFFLALTIQWTCMSVEIAYHDLLTLSPCSSWDLNSAQVQFPAVKHIRFNYSEINWWMSLTNTVRVAWNVVEIKGMKSLFFMASSCKNQRIRPNCFIKFGSACPRKSKRIMWLLTNQVSVIMVLHLLHTRNSPRERWLLTFNVAVLRWPK